MAKDPNKWTAEEVRAEGDRLAARRRQADRETAWLFVKQLAEEEPDVDDALEPAPAGDGDTGLGLAPAAAPPKHGPFVPARPSRRPARSRRDRSRGHGPAVRSGTGFLGPSGEGRLLEVDGLGVEGASWFDGHVKLEVGEGVVTVSVHPTSEAKAAPLYIFVRVEGREFGPARIVPSATRFADSIPLPGQTEGDATFEVAVAVGA